MEIEQNDSWGGSDMWTTTTTRDSIPSQKSKPTKKEQKSMTTHEKIEKMVKDAAEKVGASLQNGDEITPLHINQTITVLRSDSSLFTNYAVTGTIQQISFPRDETIGVAGIPVYAVIVTDDGSSTLKLTPSCQFFVHPEETGLSRFGKLLNESAN